jgi:hypothetical protein
MSGQTSQQSFPHDVRLIVREGDQIGPARTHAALRPLPSTANPPIPELVLLFRRVTAAELLKDPNTLTTPADSHLAKACYRQLEASRLGAETITARVFCLGLSQEACAGIA